MLVLASGCSFIWGSELSDCRHHGPGGFSKSTWPALLAKQVSASYDCVACPGAGNDVISRNVISYCENVATPDIVIVQWTFPWRFSFRFGYPINAKMEQWGTIDLWSIDDDYKPDGTALDQNDEFFNYSERMRQVAKTAGIQEFANIFFKHIAYDEYWSVYSSVKEIANLQNYLKAKNISYVFSCADNVIFECHAAKEPDMFIKMYQTQMDDDAWAMLPAGILPHETQTPRGFYQWAEENKYDRGPSGHPLDQAHQDAALIIQGKFNEVVKKHLEQNRSGNSVS